MGKQIVVENRSDLKKLVENIVSKEYGVPKDQLNEFWIKDLIKRLGSMFGAEKSAIKQVKSVPNVRIKFFNPEMNGIYYAREGRGLPQSVKTGAKFNQFATNYSDDLINIMISAKEASTTSPVWLKRRLDILQQETKDLIFYMNQSRSGTVNLNMVVGKSLSVREQLASARQDIGANLSNVKQKDLQTFFNMFTEEEKIMSNFQRELEEIILKARKPKPAVPK
jgi:hypothetical protein